MSRGFVTIILVVLAVSLATAGAVLAFPAYAPEMETATGPSTQDAARTSGVAYAWEDDAADDWDVVIGLTDPARAVVHPNAVVPAAAGNQRHPAIADGYVVYEDDRGGDWDLYTIRWAGVVGTSGPSQEWAVATGDGDQTDAAVSGQTLVYVDDARGNPDVVVHRLDTGETRRLTTDAAAQADPAVDGKWVVWADARSGNWDIYAYDLERGVQKRITTSRASQLAPQVGQGKVVYQDRRNGNWDVYLCDLKSGMERRLTSSASNQTQPSIDPHPFRVRPDTVVYVDDRKDAGDIYLRDGVTGIIKPVCTAAGAQTGPSINEEHLVWTDNRHGQADVFSCGLLYPDISIKARSMTSSYNAFCDVRGSLDGPDGTSVVGGPVWATSGGKTYKATVKGTAGSASGTFSVPVGRLRRKVTVRIRYQGNASSLPVDGGAVVIKPKASLSRPSVRYPKPPKSSNGGITLADRSKMIVSGSVRPHHAAGSKAVTLKLYKWHPSFGWQLDRSSKVAVRGSGDASTYEITLRIDDGYGVRYKVQALHSDADHAETLSAFSAVLGS
jgi:beta propeller repeat protein